MSTPAVVHQLRQRLAVALQPAHTASLTQLDELLQGFAREHPYNLAEDHFPVLCSVAAFGNGPAGRRVGAPAVTYLYRLHAVKNIPRDVTLWRGLISPKEKNETLFQHFRSQAAAAGGWCPLSRLAEGDLRGPRGFTWWSTHEISGRNPLESALRLGLPYDYTPVYAVILRLRCGPIALPATCVPSVVDAFDQPVFRPTADSTRPAAGLTIRLSATRTFCDGEAEYCIGSIPVESVEILPVLINESLRGGPGVHTDTPEFWRNLEQYYLSL